MSCKMIAIDSSTNITGYSIFNDAKFSKSDILDFSNTEDINIRFSLMVKALIDLFNYENPNIIVIELTSVTRNGKTQRILTELLGIVHGYCIIHNIFYYTYRVSQWRKIISNGEKLPANKKEWAVQTCKKMFPSLIIKSDDMAESVLIGLAYIKEFS